jgi:hypothetical protein
LSPDAGTVDTHRSAERTTRNGQFNALVRIEAVDAACRQKVRRTLCTAQDLEQHGDGGGHKGNAVDEESRVGIILISA